MSVIFLCVLIILFLQTAEDICCDKTDHGFLNVHHKMQNWDKLPQKKSMSPKRVIFIGNTNKELLIHNNMGAENSNGDKGYKAIAAINENPRGEKRAVG